MDVITALDGNWEFRIEHKGIRVYSSTVQDSDILGFKGEVAFDVPFRKLVSLFHDFGSYHRWVHQLDEMEVLSGSEELEYVVRQVINTPWPMPKRELIVRTTLHTAPSGAVALTMQGVADYLPERPDLHRVCESRGGWVLMPVEGGQVHVTFVLHMNPGNDVPPALSNAGLFEVPFYTLQKLRTLAQDPAYNPPWPTVIAEQLGIAGTDPGTH